MCLGVPGRIIERSPGEVDFARVEVEGAVRVINTSLLDGDPPAPGDWVLIHLGFALERMTEAEAREVIETAALLFDGDADDPRAPVGFAPDHAVTATAEDARR